MPATTLAPGTRLGPYEVVAPLGAGGMGEVYRARDTRLDRTVAIKVLPQDLAADPQFRARFDREARAISQLTHPHICTLYDVGDEGGTAFLVMELLQGQTLAYRLKKGALPLEEALKIAIEIADALSAAHRQGIVHRDLKPGNIMLVKTGAKLLDFGLAKVATPAVAMSANSTHETATTDVTSKGSILGTLHYMAPEQVEGREADTRSDIWALGAVIYEMVTGHLAFAGESSAAVVGAILKDRPLPLADRRPEAPPALDHLVARCLEKDVDERWQSASDVKRELAWIATPTNLVSGTDHGTTHTTRRTSLRIPWLVAAIVALAAAGLAVPAVRYLREPPPAAPLETRVDIVTPASADPFSFALSPDGRQIVFVAAGDGAQRLWLRSLAATTTQPLAGTEGASFPFWSPDGRSLGFFAGGQLQRLDVGSGAPRTLAAAPTPRGGTWNPDGVILFSPSPAGPLFRVAAAGGSAVPVTTLDRQASHRWPFFLPDGRHFLFYAQGGPETQGVYLGALDADAPTRLNDADSAGVYLPAGAGLAEALGEGGWLLWGRGGKLVAQRLDLARPALAGDPATLADEVASWGAINCTAVSVSANGLVAYRAGGAGRRQLTWRGRSGTVLGTLGEPDDGSLHAPSVAPDGRRVVVAREAQGNQDLWLLDGPRQRRLTFDPGRDQNAVWSPDGRRIVFDADRTGGRHLYVKDPSGASPETLLVDSAQPMFASDWSADGRFLLYFSLDPQTGPDLWVRPMMGDPTPWPFLKTAFDERNGRFSPDGRWVVYQSNESGRPEIYVRPFTAPASSGAAVTAPNEQWQVSTDGGSSPSWHADGQGLYYLGPNGEMMTAPVTVRGIVAEPGTPVVLFPTRILGGGGGTAGLGRQYDVTRDGRFLINTLLDDPVATPITLIQNWNPDAKK